MAICLYWFGSIISGVLLMAVIESLVNNVIHGRSSEVKRASAVAAALEAIIAKVGQSPSNHGQLEQEMANLSRYADQIEEALSKRD